MMYLIRIAFFFVIPIAVFFLTKKRIHLKRWLIISILILSFLLFGLSVAFPIEREFIQFETPEKAFRYAHLNERILDITYGNRSAMIISEKWGNDYSVCFIEKVDNGYKIPRFGGITTVQTGPGSFQVIKVEAVEEYYYYGIEGYETETEIYDTNGNMAKSLSIGEANSITSDIKLYYNYIENYDNSFSLIIKRSE